MKTTQLNSNIFYKDKTHFEKKLQNLISSYDQNKKSVAVITDFDYTMTILFDYNTGKQYKSSYYLYDEDLIGGDQKKFDEKRKKLDEEYAHYEFDTSFDIKIREQKMDEWYTKNLELYFIKKFTMESIDMMVQKLKNNIKFRPKLKEYIDLLLSIDIPLIIESGGVTQFIYGALKLIYPNIDDLIKQKKIMIISNSFKFDEKDKGCCGVEHEVIHCFNKADFIGNNIHKEFPELKHVFILGDHLGDADCTKIFDKENVIGFGFVNLPINVLNDENKKEFIDSKIKEYNNVFDVALVGNCDYEPIIEILKRIK
jgi:HAD superfamily hydrolase (TIGR01544 family)